MARIGSEQHSWDLLALGPGAGLEDGGPGLDLLRLQAAEGSLSWALVAFEDIAPAAEPIQLRLRLSALGETVNAGLRVAWADWDNERWVMTDPVATDSAGQDLLISEPAPGGLAIESVDSGSNRVIVAFIATAPAALDIRLISLMHDFVEPPAAFSASQGTQANGILLRWGRPSELLSPFAYLPRELDCVEIERNSNPLVEDWTRIALVNSEIGSTEYLDAHGPENPLPRGIGFFYRARYVDALSQPTEFGPWTEIVSGERDIHPVDSLGFTAYKFELDWLALSSKGIDGFRLQRRNVNLSTQGSHEWVEVDSADARPGWRLPIEPGVDFGVYEYRIKALFGAEESNGWTLSDGSFSMLPHVDVLSATQGSLPGAVEITWQQVNWADYYVIHRIHNGQVNGSFVAEASASSYIDDTNGSQLVFTYAVKGGGADWISFDYGQTKTGYGGPPDL